MENNIFEPRHKEMGRHVISGVLSSGMLQIVTVLCQFGSVIFLSRLLSPSDFGIFAMAGPAFGFVMMFQNLGLSQATIQKPDIGHGDVNAFFWLNVAAGILLGGFLVALSPLAGWYYGDPRVVPLTAALGALVLVNALGSQHGAIMQRRMEFKISNLIGCIGTICGLGVSIAWAIVFKNYWALYFGLLASTVISVIGVWVVVRWRPSFPRLTSGIGDMLKFGAAITTTNLSVFFSRYMDNVLIGHRWGDQILGYYDRAYKLLLFPLQRIVDPISGTMIPVLSRLTHDARRYRSIYLRTVSQLVLITWPGIIWAIVYADILIPALLGKRWINSMEIFRPLAMAGLLQVLNSSSGWLFITQKRSAELARWAIFNAIACIIAFLIGLPYGALGVATAYAIGEYIKAPFLWWYTTRSGLIRFKMIGTVILPQFIGGAIAGVSLILFRQLKIQLHPILILAIGLFLSYIIAALTISLFPKGRETLKQSLAAGKKTLLHMNLRID